MKLYRSFLVRCWREGESEPPVWRFALIEIGQTEQARGFADWQALARYLDEIARGLSWHSAPGAPDFDKSDTPNQGGS